MKTVLITGASSGLGLEFAKIFAKNGYNLVLTARDEKRLTELKKEIEDAHGTKIKIIAKDLSTPNASQSLYKTLKEDKIHIDILVNNAGFGTYGPFTETDLDEEISEIQVNVLALTTLSKLFLKDMVEKGGKVLNIASIAAFSPGPLMAVYYATKAYVLSLSLALASEFKNKNITVTVLCPGYTKTNFYNTPGMKTGSNLFKPSSMEPYEVALAGYEGLMKGKRIVVPGFANKFVVGLQTFLPKELVSDIIMKLRKK